jgi:hypothetical protein
MTSIHWASGLEVLAAISPAFALLLMEPQDNQKEEEVPNLPLVAVRGITTSDAMRVYERYNLDFAPPGYTELKLCEVVIALEELVLDFTRAEERRRTRGQE